MTNPMTILVGPIRFVRCYVYVYISICTSSAYSITFLTIERELLADRARRLVWQAYLQMADLPFTSEAAPNADYMSPSGEKSHDLLTGLLLVLTYFTF